MSTTTSPPPLPPAVLAQRYRLERRLAQGGMAEVWLGTDLSLSRQVAIKLLKPNLASDPVVAERFRREAIAVAQLNHPNIVAVYDAIEDNGRQAVVMQLVNGKSLRQLLDEQKKLSPELTIHIGSCVAVALDAAHQAGMVHRDVKPGNILITPDGRVLLTDFGIAKGLEPTGDDLTNDNIMMGTAKYLSPEQVRGKRLDGRADLYSLGLVLYECLAGRVPFLGQNDADTALARLQRDPTDLTRLRPTLPPGLADLIHRLLARRPDQRYPSGAAVKAALAEVNARAAEVTWVDDTGPALAAPTPTARPLPIDPTLRKPYDQAATNSLPVRDVPTGAAAATVSPVGPVGRDPRTTGPVRAVPAARPSGGRPAGPAVVRADRDRTPTGSAPVSRRPNRNFEHRRAPSLIVVGGLLLVATIVSAVLWSSLGTDSDGGDFPTPTPAPSPASSLPAVEPSEAQADAATELASAGPTALATPAGDPTSETALRSVRTWDAHTDDPSENDDQVGLVLDGDPGTSWTTRCYAADDLGGLPVGLGLTLVAPVRGTLEIDVASDGWSIEVFGTLASDMPGAIGGWGERLASQAGSGPSTVAVQITSASLHLLVVFREVGPSRACTEAYPFGGAISEVRFDALS